MSRKQLKRELLSAIPMLNHRLENIDDLTLHDLKTSAQTIRQLYETFLKESITKEIENKND